MKLINMVTKKGLLIFIAILIVLLIFASICIFTSNNYFRYHFSKVSKEVSDATVIVELLLPDGTANEICSGFIIDKRGYVITADHCYTTAANAISSNSNQNITAEYLINNGGRIHVITNSINKYFKVISIENQNLKRKDVQLLKISEPIYINLPTSEIAEQGEVNSPGLDIGFIGYTMDNQNIKHFEKFVSKGILSNIKLDKEGQTEPSYTINAFSTFGYSGGPVYLSENGKIIGLISGGTGDGTGKTGIVFVPTIHNIPEIIKELESR